MSITQTREEWLASLKSGDQVVVTDFGTQRIICKVVKRMPSGRIVLDNGNRFNAQGEEIGIGWPRLSLHPVTPKLHREIAHRALANDVYHVISSLDNINRLRSLSDEQLEELLAVLKRYTVERQ